MSIDNMKKNKNNFKSVDARSAKRVWIFGKHSVCAALNNSERACFRLMVTKNCHEVLKNVIGSKNPEIVTDDKISAMLPKDVVHQGIAGEFSLLPENDLNSLLDGSGRSVVLLDQVTDPHNVGAILRSCSAFNVLCIVMTDRNSPPESGILAKSASGALEIVPIVRVPNLAEAIKDLKKAGYWVVGMDGSAKEDISVIGKYKPVALVMGAEGKGMRRLTEELCDVAVKIPISEVQESLNVSNAAAIALWELQ